MARKIIKQRYRIFWGWEGISERNYGGYLQMVADCLQVPVHFDREHNLIGGGDPLSIVEACAKVSSMREQQRGKFDKKVILLDMDRWGDDKDRDAKANLICRKNKIDLLFQRWDHEAFLLRHHSDEKNSQPPAKGSMKPLKKVWPEYEKPCSANDLYGHFGCDPFSFLSTVELKFGEFLDEVGIKHKK